MPNIMVRVDSMGFVDGLLKLCKQTKEIKNISPLILDNLKAIVTDPVNEDKIIHEWAIGQAFWGGENQWRYYIAPEDPDVQFPFFVRHWSEAVCEKLKDILPDHELTKVMSVYLFAEFLANYLEKSDITKLEECFFSDMWLDGDEVFFGLASVPEVEQGFTPASFDMDLDEIAAKKKILGEIFELEELHGTFSIGEFE